MQRTVKSNIRKMKRQKKKQWSDLIKCSRLWIYDVEKLKCMYTL